MSGGTHVVEPADQFWPRVGVHQTREVDVVPLLDHLQLQRLAQLDRDPGRVCTHQRVTGYSSTGEQETKVHKVFEFLEKDPTTRAFSC